MAKGLLLVFSKPVSEDREDAFNCWYDQHHLQDVIDVDGFISGTRYRVSEQQMRAGVESSTIAELPYLATYEVDADDPKAAIRALIVARENFFREDKTLDFDSVFSVFFEQITEPVTV